MTNTIRDIVIAGGGTAGWMTAAALARHLPRHAANIALVESAAIGTIGVGEATIPPLTDFNDMLGIDEDEFLSTVGGSFKLGIEFCDWARVGDRYFHPFSVFGHDINGIAFHQLWLELQRDGDTRAFDEFTIGAHAARAEKFIRSNERDPRSPLSQIRHAYHIDAHRYAALLRRYAEAHGVRRVEGRIEAVALHPESGDIESLKLDGQRDIHGSFFIDCTGFRALLIGDALGAEFEDWTHWLPCDRALAVASDRSEHFGAFTRATAHGAGWQWRIPLQHRTGNGCVYASNWMTDEDAERQLLAGLDTKALDSARPLKFRTGRRRELWRKNCVAIGLSSGFVEPLESTSIHLIQEGISKLLALFPADAGDTVERDQYNRLLGTLYEYIRDFIVLHYHATERDDTDFWRYLREMKIPDSLQHHLDLFRRHGRFFYHRSDLFTITSWTAVLLGQRVMPAGADVLASVVDRRQLRAALDDIHRVYQTGCEHMPPHSAFVERFCADRMSAPGETRHAG